MQGYNIKDYPNIYEMNSGAFYIIKTVKGRTIYDGAYWSLEEAKQRVDLGLDVAPYIRKRRSNPGPFYSNRASARPGFLIWHKPESGPRIYQGYRKTEEQANEFIEYLTAFGPERSN